MRAILELNVPDQETEAVSAEQLGDAAHKAMEAISASNGVQVFPRLLLEIGPRYLELPIRRMSKGPKHME